MDSKLKLLLALVLAGLVAGACAPAGGPAPTEAPAVTGATEATAAAETPAAQHVWAMVTDQHGLGDQGFNDLAHKGLVMAREEFGGEIKVVESTEQAQYVPNLTSLAQARVTLVAGIGFLLIDAMNEVAPQFSDVPFALVDAVVEQPNVASLVFRENEGAYLGGIMAGMLTQSNKLGYVGGLEIPPVIHFQAGFEAGVRTVNPDAQVLIGYVGSFDDPAKGKEVALSQYNAGADIVFEVGGGSGVGAFEAAKEKGQGFWIFGSDTCKQRLAPDNSLPDVTKGVDQAIFQTASAIVDGSFEGDVHSFGLKEGGMGLCPETFDTLPDEVKAKIEKARQMIEEGSLVIPDDLEKLESFEPPEL